MAGYTTSMAKATLIAAVKSRRLSGKSKAELAALTKTELVRMLNR